MNKQKTTAAIRRLIDIPYHQLEHFPQEDALVAISGDQFTRYSTQDLIDRMDQVSLGLLAAGFDAGDKISIISENRPEWNFFDLGMQQIGIVNVPVYPNVDPQTYRYTFENAGVKAVFVSNAGLFEKVQSIAMEVDTLQEIYTFEKIEGAKHWSELLEEGRDEDPEQIAEHKEKVNPEDLATIVYTSGTTGNPKGVMLSHRNIVSNLNACTPIMPVDHRHRALSFLPLNHVFERMMNYLYLANGIPVYYAESIDTIGDNLRLVQPHIFTTVPRLLEKVYEKIRSKGEEQSGLGRLIFSWSWNLAQHYQLRGNSPWYRLQHRLADQLVYPRWREALGGEVMAIVSGGAALNPKIARAFTAAGIPALEGYGLTETSPVIAVNRMEKSDRKFGSVGKVIDNVSVKIAEDGEILCKGPNVMQGYYEMPDKTEEVMEEDGWLHTGDIGEMDEEGFLSITDRKKSVFKTSGGKYVAPQRIENSFSESAFIENVMAVGEGRKMVTALIQPNFEKLEAWCRKEGIDWDSREELTRNEKVRKKYEMIAEKQNDELDHTEEIKKFRLVAEEWTVESGELTPTMKIKREVLQNRYESKIEEMYNNA